MPVFVEWKWQDKTKTFLVIFNFFDDFSKPNLRITKPKKRGSVIQHLTLSDSKFTDETWMTWSPSHPELALLSELLSYANIINGLKESEKRQLKLGLEGIRMTPQPDGRIWEDIDLKFVASLRMEMGDDKKITGYIQEDDPQRRFRCCVELCSGYINYLRKLLDPYLKK